jgi:hypothetical protein
VLSDSVANNFFQVPSEKKKIILDFNCGREKLSLEFGKVFLQTGNCTELTGTVGPNYLFQDCQND